jgi:poly(hydroxyalkanoate) depolymerase family esterase
MSKAWGLNDFKESQMLHTVLNAWTSVALTGWSNVSDLYGNPSVQEKAGGKFKSGKFESADGALNYKLFVPSTYSGTPMPLVVMLHGGGQDADDFALGTGMNELAEEFQFLVLYPEQSCGSNWQRCWNWFEKAHHERGQGEPALIAGMTQAILSEYAVDETRVCIAGLSAGGAMALIVGRVYPDLFTAVGCHSGLAHRSATDGYAALQAMRDGVDECQVAKSESSPSVPVIVFHGDMDTTVHVKNSRGIVQQSIEAYLAQTSDEDVEVAFSEDTGETASRRFTRNVHRGKAGEVVAEHWTLHGAGHAWSGGSRRGSYTDAYGPDASKEMLRFFL